MDSRQTARGYIALHKHPQTHKSILTKHARVDRSLSCTPCGLRGYVIRGVRVRQMKRVRVRVRVGCCRCEGHLLVARIVAKEGERQRWGGESVESGLFTLNTSGLLSNLCLQPLEVLSALLLHLLFAFVLRNKLLLFADLLCCFFLGYTPDYDSQTVVTVSHQPVKFSRKTSHARKSNHTHRTSPLCTQPLIKRVGT